MSTATPARTTSRGTSAPVDDAVPGAGDVLLDEVVPARAPWSTVRRRRPDV